MITGIPASVSIYNREILRLSQSGGYYTDRVNTVAGWWQRSIFSILVLHSLGKYADSITISFLVLHRSGKYPGRLMTAKNFLNEKFRDCVGGDWSSLRKDSFGHHLRLIIWCPLLSNIDYLKNVCFMKSWNHLVVGMGDILVFLLNEYFDELNTVKFKFLNWIFQKKISLNKFFDWVLSEN